MASHKQLVQVNLISTFSVSFLEMLWVSSNNVVYVSLMSILLWITIEMEYKLSAKIFFGLPTVVKHLIVTDKEISCYLPLFSPD